MEFPVRFIYIILFIFFIISPSFGNGLINLYKINYEKNFPEIELFVNINKYNFLNPSLKKENFTIFEDDFPVNFFKVSHQLNDEIYIAFLIDSSSSISDTFFKKIKDSSSKIINISPDKSKLMILKFDEKIKILNTFASSREKLINSMSSLKRTKGGTLLYDSIFDSINLLNKLNKKEKALIVFTDGKDEGSKLLSKDTMDKIKMSSIPIFFICPKPGHRLKLLSRFSKVSNGKLFLSKTLDDIPGMYNSILSLLKNRYLLTFRTPFYKGKKNHKIEVRLKIDNIQDRDIKNISYLQKKITINSLLLFSPIVNFLVILFLFLFSVILLIFILRQKKLFRKISDNQTRLPYIKSELNRLSEKSNDLNEDRDFIIEKLEQEREIYSKAWLIRKDLDINNKFYLSSNEIFIGSGDSCDICIKDERVSFEHAKIKKINGFYYLFDLISGTGTFLNNKKLLRPKELFDWDEIMIANVILYFRAVKND